MKIFPQALVALTALLSVASAFDMESTSTKNTIGQSQVSSRRLDDSDFYPNGTPVSYYEDDQWYDGVVMKVASGTYTIKWDDEDETEEIEAGSEMDHMVEDGNGDDDAAPTAISVTADAITSDAEAIAIGTEAFIWEDGEWYEGKITDHSNDEYTVVWSDGDSDTYEDNGDDLKELMQAIEDAMGDDDDVTDDEYDVIADNYDGISNDADSSNDGDDAYDDDAAADDAVANDDDASEDASEDGNDDNVSGDGAYDDDAAADDDASGDDDADYVSAATVAVGSPLAIYENGSWVDGEVTAYANGGYTVVWSQGTDSEYVDEYDSEGEDLDELKQAMEDAQGDDDAAPDGYEFPSTTWEVGTIVSVQEDDDDTTYYGYIEDYQNGEYSIAWDDGESEWIRDIEIVDQMVADAAASPKPTGMHAAGKSLLAIMVMSATALALVLLYSGHKNKQALEVEKVELRMGAGAFKELPPRGEANYYKKQAENLRMV